MLQNSTSTFSSIRVLAAVALASSTDNSVESFANEDALVRQACGNNCDDSITSGSSIMFDEYVSNKFIRSCSISDPVENSSADMQQRYKAIKNSFIKHSKGFPEEKKGHFSALANAVCKLQFNDNISVYNEYDETIDTVLMLSEGLTLSISQFLGEEADAPAVFSIHRHKILLVSDEMPIRDIVNTVNAVMEKC